MPTTTTTGIPTTANPTQKPTIVGETFAPTTAPTAVSVGLMYHAKLSFVLLFVVIYLI